jgi:hypothetical protein
LNLALVILEPSLDAIVKPEKKLREATALRMADAEFR